MKILKTLGNTGLRCSAIALGTVEIGLDYGIPSDQNIERPDEADAIRFLNQALDLGVNFIDTAQVYGRSEDLIGQALKGRRQEYLLATKLAPITATDLEDEACLRVKVRESVENSLRCLRTDYVDVLMLHSATLEVVMKGEVLIQLLREQQRQGTARFVGASVYEGAGVAAVSCGGFDIVQIGYSALDRSPEHAMLPLAKAKGVGVVARSVLLKGALTPRYHSLPQELSDVKDAAGQLDSLAREAGLTLVELAYRYLLSEEVVPLCGTARIGELQEVWAYAKRGPLNEDLVSAIRLIEIQDKRLLHPGSWPF